MLTGRHFVRYFATAKKLTEGCVSFYRKEVQREANRRHTKGIFKQLYLKYRAKFCEYKRVLVMIS